MYPEHVCSFLFEKGSLEVLFHVVVLYIGCSKAELFHLFLFRRIEGRGQIFIDSIHLPSLARGGMSVVLIFQRAVAQVCLAYLLPFLVAMEECSVPQLGSRSL